MKVTLQQAAALIEIYIKAKLVPMIHGSPGIGKSAIVQAFAKKYNLKVIDERLSQADPTDLKGLPDLSGAKATFRPFDTYPLEGDELPEGYDGWCLFLDELTSAPQSVQAPAYKLILDRMVGQAKLHPRVVIVAAGNLATDGAIVLEMSTALQSRLAHIEVENDLQEFLDYIATEKFDPRIASYLSMCSHNLHSLKPDHTDHTYACNRTWAFTNQIIKDLPESHPLFLPALAGVISPGVAMEFQAHCRIHAELPKMSVILGNPKTAPVPEEPSVLWALTGALSDTANDINCQAVIDFTSRLPIEFQVVTMRALTRRKPALKKHAAVATWIANSSMEIF